MIQDMLGGVLAGAALITLMGIDSGNWDDDVGRRFINRRNEIQSRCEDGCAEMVNGLCSNACDLEREVKETADKCLDQLNQVRHSIEDVMKVLNSL